MKRETKWLIGVASVYGLSAILYGIINGITPPEAELETNTEPEPDVVQDVIQDENTSDMTGALVDLDFMTEQEFSLIEPEVTGTDAVPLEWQSTDYVAEPTINNSAYEADSSIDNTFLQDSIIEEDPTLPLKAECADGTIQYQDDPSGPNYRGMCSSHGGIVKKFGRVP